jgi:hypothetical protein
MKIIGMKIIGVNMEVNKYIAITLSLFSFCTAADQIEIPHTFSAGSKAIASQVNENFLILKAESNSQNTRIQTTESHLQNVITAGKSQNDRIEEIGTQLNEVIIESNSQDGRINALEEAALTTVVDQLICEVGWKWITNGSAYNCVQRSDSSNIRSMTYIQVAEEGWNAVSVGTGGSDAIYIFSK